MLRRLHVGAFASVPVRAAHGQILGCLTIFGVEPRRPMPADELRMLESLAEMVASQLELRRLRRVVDGQETRPPRPTAKNVADIWPRQPDLRRALDQGQFRLYLSAGSGACHAQDHRP